MVVGESSQQVVLVTGAAGFIGSHLGSALIRAGSQVIGLDNGRSGDWSRCHPDLKRIDVDICDLDSDQWLEICRDVDVVFHLAAEKYNSSRSSPQKVIATNIEATGRLVDSAGAAGVGKVVFTSSLYAYGNVGPKAMSESDLLTPTTNYGMSKVAGENLLRVGERDHGLDWAVARLMFVYGPRQWAEGGYKSVILANFERIMRGEPPIINGDGEQCLDYVFVDDVVAALVALAAPGYPNLICNVASGVGVSVNRLVDLMCEVSGTALTPVRGPADWTAGTSRVGRSEVAADQLGWRARTSLRAGLAEVWDWMQEDRL